MSELLHRIKVFAYRLAAGGPRYLLLKPDQGLEALWGPVQGEVGFGDQLESAVRRRLAEDTAILTAAQLLDLETPAHWTLGDEEIIEWCYGVRCLDDPDPEILEARFSAHRWAGFSDAYPRLGLELDRAAILRLHAQLGAA